MNENHKRRLLIGFRYVNDLLSDIEKVMETPVDQLSPFQIYIADVTLAQKKDIAADITQFREEMCRILENKGIKIDPPGISAARAVRTAIHFADIAMEEMRPKHMRGYGKISEEAMRELNELATHMQELLKQMLKALK